MKLTDRPLRLLPSRTAIRSAPRQLPSRLLTLLAAVACGLPAAGQVDPFSLFDQVDPSYVMVAAHRCGYLSNASMTHPENSLSAAQSSIALGVEILETDVRMTSDGGLVLMHDTTVNRTTNGSGTVSSMTLAQVRSLHLLGPGGVVSSEIVPTLEELMIVAKGEVLVNLDKVDINNTTLRDNVMAVLIATETVDHAIFKGGASAAQVAAMRAAYPGETIHYMPILSNSNESVMISTLNSHTPPAIELIFNSSGTTMLSAASVAAAAATDTHIWINSLWSSLCAGHHDAVALAGDPDGSWGWLTDKGATILQTDNAPQMIPYLESRGLRDDVPPVAIDFDFDDGTRQGWVNTLAGPSGTNPARFEARTDQGRGGGHTPDYSLLHDGDGTWLDGRDVTHATLVVSSPAFDLDEANQGDWGVSFQLLGGTGNTSSAPVSLSALPATTDTTGFLGVALRRVIGGAYLLYDHRDATGQYGDWEGQGWSSAEIATAIAGDQPGLTYQLDLIDQSHGDWGWTILDTVTIGGIVPPGVPFCGGDGTGTPCPCGNENDGSVPDSGCANGAFPSGAQLVGSGLASLSEDTLVLSATGLEPNNSGLYFQGDHDLSPGSVWGDGLRCAGGSLKRLGVRVSDAAGASDTSGLPLTISTRAGNIAPGDTKYYQCWYRNSIFSPCFAEFNATNGYAITWRP